MTVDFAMIEQAGANLGLPVTPAWAYPMLNELAGCEVVVKHENMQPTGAFKVRGGLTWARTLSDRDRATGVVTVSTGNHAQSIAYAAREHGFSATIVMPATAPTCKADAVRALGADVVMHGPTMVEAGSHARQFAMSTGKRFIDPGNEPAVVAGHATAYLELLTQHPDLQAIYVPVGSGTGAAGACLVRDVLAPQCRIIGVQSAQARAGHDSWHRGDLVSRPVTTFAGGLATGCGYALPQSILRDRLDDFVVVDDSQIQDAVRVMATHAHTLAEGAGAASLAALLADEDRPQRCAVMCTGGNAAADEFALIGATAS